eukprot:6660924-Prymnesium_polylepis.1
MNVPLVAVSEMAPDTPAAAVCAAATVGVLMVAVTVIEPAAMERVTSVALTPAAAASAAM